MGYSANQELIDILLKNGFTDDSEKKNPEHWKRLIEKKKYDPYSIKRFFKKGRIEIKFDYISIEIRYNSSTFCYVNYTIEDFQLNALLKFSNLSSNKKHAMMNKYRSPFMEMSKEWI